LNIPHRPVGLFWATGLKKTADQQELQLLANALSVSRLLQRWLGPFADQEGVAQRLEDAARVAGRTAHDMDNVFQSILGFGSLAARQVVPNTVLADNIKEVLAATDNGIRICSQLHQLSRAGSAKPFPGSLRNALAAEANRLREHKNNVNIDWSVAPELPAVAIDEGGLRQLFGFLLNNAVEASAPGGSVQVLSRVIELQDDPPSEGRGLREGHSLTGWLGRPSAGTNIEVIVRDRGAGMNADAQRRVFVEPFFTTKFGHRGLGLVTAYRMLYAHRGGVRVASVVGRGTEITVVLPLALPMFRSTDSRSTGGSP
jgi:signal transduction histidine kinase